MKYILILLLISSCSVIPHSLKRYDTKGFSHDGNTVYFENKPMAVIQAITFSLDGKKLVREINLKVLNPQEQNKIPNMIRYIYNSHNTSEVEVEIEMTHN